MYRDCDPPNEGTSLSWADWSVLLACAIATAASGPLQAQTGSAAPPAPVVPGYEQLRLAGAADEAALGEILLGELNCLSCHTPTAAVAERIPTRAAPDLDRIAERATGRWLADYLLAPHEQKPGSAMPDVLHSLEPDDREDVVRTLIGYLAHRGSKSVGSGSPEPRSGTADRPVATDTLGEFPVHRFQATVERGRRLFHSVGCVACHAPEGAEGEPAIPSVPLPNLNAKTSVAALAGFLLDPRAARPGGRMPPLHLEREEAEAMAVYLLRGQTPLVTERRRGFEFEYYLDPEQDEDVPGFFLRPGAGPRRAAPGRRRPCRHPVARSADFDEQRQPRVPLQRPVATPPPPGTYTFTLASDRRSGSSLRVGDDVLGRKAPLQPPRNGGHGRAGGGRPSRGGDLLHSRQHRPALRRRPARRSGPAQTEAAPRTDQPRKRPPAAGRRPRRARATLRGGRQHSLCTLRLLFVPHVAGRRSRAGPVLRRVPGQGSGPRRPGSGTDARRTRHAWRRNVAAVPAGEPPEAGHPRRACGALRTCRPSAGTKTRSRSPWRASTVSRATGAASATWKSAARTRSGRGTSGSSTTRTSATKGGFPRRFTALAAS